MLMSMRREVQKVIAARRRKRWRKIRVRRVPFCESIQQLMLVFSSELGHLFLFLLCIHGRVEFNVPLPIGLVITRVNLRGMGKAQRP